MYIPSVAVEPVHHASEDNAVGRGVVQPGIGDGIVDHFMEQYALELMLALIVVVAHAERIVVIDDFAP